MMSNFYALLAIVAALLVLWRAAIVQGRLRERAKQAENENEATRKAVLVQNRVASDPAFRERVRRFFSGA